MSDPVYFLLPLIALAAFVLKGITGFGPAIVVIAFGSLLLPPQTIIAVSAILDLAGGGALLRMDRASRGRRFWIPLALAILLGAVAGSFFLKVVPAGPFRISLSAAIFLLGIWFLAGRGRIDPARLRDSFPDRCRPVDAAVTALGGFCGGFFGISGPPIIWHFGRMFTKQVFRQALIRIFLVAAAVRVIAYAGLGMVDGTIVLYALAAMPGLFLGIWLGDRIFLKISETAFGRIVGAVLLLVAVKLFAG